MTGQQGTPSTELFKVCDDCIHAAKRQPAGKQFLFHSRGMRDRCTQCQSRRLRCDFYRIIENNTTETVGE